MDTGSVNIRLVKSLGLTLFICFRSRKKIDDNSSEPSHPIMPGYGLQVGNSYYTANGLVEVTGLKPHLLVSLLTLTEVFIANH